MTTALTAHPFSVSSARPPPGFLQLPWAPAPDAAWTFDGVHDWNEAEGSGPMASIDFFRLKHGAGGGCGSNLLEWGEPEPAWVTAVADGRLRTVRGADGEPIPCWAEVEHAGGWTSWYYHVQQIQADADGAFVRRGQRVARLATTREAAECFGGDAREHPHLHFSLLANGSFVGLHGVQLSRWVVHAGECSYDCRCEHAYLALAAAPSCRRCPFCELPHRPGAPAAECPTDACDPGAACGCGCAAAAVTAGGGVSGLAAGLAEAIHDVVGSDDYADAERGTSTARAAPPPRRAAAKTAASAVLAPAPGAWADGEGDDGAQALALLQFGGGDAPPVNRSVAF